MTDTALEFQHVFKKFRRGEGHDSLRDLIPALFRKTFQAQREKRFKDKRVLGLEGRILPGGQGGGARNRWAERIREKHHPEDPQRNPEADRRNHAGERPDQRVDRGGGRFPPGPDRQGKHLSQRRDPRDEPIGNPAENGRHRRFFRNPGLHRHPGETVLLRDVREAGVRDRRARGAGNPAGR